MKLCRFSQVKMVQVAKHYYNLRQPVKCYGYRVRDGGPNTETQSAKRWGGIFGRGHLASINFTVNTLVPGHQCLLAINCSWFC